MVNKVENQSLIKDAAANIASAQNLENLDNIRVQYLGKNGIITEEMKKLGQLSEVEKKEYGKWINEVRDNITQLLNLKKQELYDLEINAKLSNEQLDVTLPARYKKLGSIHPISKAIMELTEIFASFGFTVSDGPNIEDDWHNFTALNFPENHPARQMHDTFFLKSGKLLRTHTSPTQIRTMQSSQPPFKFISPGKTYRCDSDMTHTPMFNQIEGLMVDKKINIGNLKFIIIEFIKHYFENKDIEFRFRPSFFPFTEPSYEVDIKIPGKDSWLEVLGCGMVHPNVLKNCNIDTNIYSGFAFGMGVERFAMLKYGISDLREFFEGDVRWLKHFNFSSFDIPSMLAGLTN